MAVVSTVRELNSHAYHILVYVIRRNRRAPGFEDGEISSIT